jgi:hypothetical protein
VLAESGQSLYEIVVADDASPSVRHATEELQSHLQQMTGAKLPIVSDREPIGAKEILLGDNAHLGELGVKLDRRALGQEGYLLRTVGDHLVIAGGPARGTLYGVYGFLEDHLGCRWFTPEVSRFPKATRLTIGSLDGRKAPALDYREPYIFECLDGDWSARNRVNGFFSRLTDSLGGRPVVFAAGLFCHTFESLVPPAKYFDSHPEYFALVDGKRQNKGSLSQLCCTNPDVIRLCIEGIRAAMRDQPHATVFSVSQNDGPGGYCQCPNCQKLADKEDSQIAPVLQLVNRVAEAVEKDFPDKLVETLAYEWTRRPAKHIRPRSNVVIRLCTSGPCCFSHPLATCDSGPSRAFRADMEAWEKVAPRLWVWDYVADFASYVMPYPNLRVLGPNIQYFAAHRVQGVFELGSYNFPGGDFAALKGYMLAKLLWNPNADTNRLQSEFLEAYYGKAAAPIKAYLDTLHDYVDHENIHLTDYVAFESPHLTDPQLVKVNDLWNQAEQLTAAEPQFVQRVKSSRIGVDCAILERARLQKRSRLPKNEALMTLARARIKPFTVAVRDGTLANLAEQAVDKEDYCRKLAADLGLESQ